MHNINGMPACVSKIMFSRNGPLDISTSPPVDRVGRCPFHWLCLHYHVALSAICLCILSSVSFLCVYFVCLNICLFATHMHGEIRTTTRAMKIPYRGTLARRLQTAHATLHFPHQTSIHKLAPSVVIFFCFAHTAICRFLANSVVYLFCCSISRGGPHTLIQIRRRGCSNWLIVHLRFYCCTLFFVIYVFLCIFCFLFC